MKKSINEIKSKINMMKTRSAWQRGVHAYADDILSILEESVQRGFVQPEYIRNRSELEKTLLNGAVNWHQYSWYGFSLIYDEDIAERLCNNTELKRTNHGRLDPNSYERWLDVQTRALAQAAELICNVAF